MENGMEWRQKFISNVVGRDNKIHEAVAHVCIHIEVVVCTRTKIENYLSERHGGILVVNRNGSYSNVSFLFSSSAFSRETHSIAISSTFIISALSAKHASAAGNARQITSLAARCASFCLFTTNPGPMIIFTFANGFSKTGSLNYIKDCTILLFFHWFNCLLFINNICINTKQCLIAFVKGTGMLNIKKIYYNKKNVKKK